MLTVEELEKEVALVDLAMQAAIDRFEVVITGVLESASRGFISDMSALTVAASQYEQSTANMAWASGAASRIKARIEEAGYSQAVEEYVVSFADIIDHTRNLVEGMEETFTMTQEQQNSLMAMQEQDIYQFASLTELSSKEIQSSLFEAVVTGGRSADTANLIHEMLAGSQSELAKYSGVYAQDSIMRYHSALNRLVMTETGTWYYAGTIMARTRPFCRSHVGHAYSEEYIKALSTVDWAGKAPGDVLIVRGGYNCRHMWVPVPRDWAQEEGVMYAGE
jgi:hypothetical protein